MIDSSGNIFPCGSLSYNRDYYFNGQKYSHPRVTFGNLEENDLHIIWNSFEYADFRKKAALGKLPSYCKDCLIKDGVICKI